MIDPSLSQGLAIQQPVGRGGINTPADTRLVQEALNLVPAFAGGPATPLNVDGLCGPRTIAAIEGVEKANGEHLDGTLRPDEDLGRWLAEWLRKAARPALKLGLSSIVGTAFRDTRWKISGTSGFELSLGRLGVQGGYVTIVSDAEPGRARRLGLCGLGTGVSVVPLGVSFSTADMPSWGSRLVRPWMAAEPAFSDFQGLAVILSLGAVGAVAGPSAALFMFGADSPTILGAIQSFLASHSLLDGNNPIVSGLRTVFNQSRAAGVGWGTVLGTGNASATLYSVYVAPTNADERVVRVSATRR